MSNPLLVTVHGVLSLEEYVARVTTAENGMAADAALEAQAIAARTYVLRAMRDNPGLGTLERPIPSSESFQVMASAATVRCVLASVATWGQVITYRGMWIIANYVAGAPWIPPGLPDPASKEPTEVFVTYNENRHGDEVTPTTLAAWPRVDNRGCMSQRGADWLARNAGYDAAGILRFFYGADIEIVPAGEQKTIPRRPVVANGANANGGVVLMAGLWLGLLLMRQS